MTIKVYFAAGRERWPEWEAPLRAAFAACDLAVSMSPEPPRDPARVDYIIFAPGGDIEDFTPYTRCKAVLNLWAGVEKIVGNPTLTQPLCRMVDPALTEGMVEYVTGHALRYHLEMHRHLQGQDGVWRSSELPPLARERPVAMLGIGALGAACGRALAGLGFPVMGWSRTPREIDGLACHSDEDGLKAVLRKAGIVVTLLPDTPQTRTLINAERLALLPEGAYLINPGRGPLIDDNALLAALDSGRVAGATLDVFRTEPLPPYHPYWHHPRATVTPHIAAATRPQTASRIVAENIRRGEADQPFLHRVDRDRGY